MKSHLTIFCFVVISVNIYIWETIAFNINQSSVGRFDLISVLVCKKVM